MVLRNRLRELRSQQGLTQVSLAEKVGVTRQTIISVEKGKFVPSVKLALQLAGTLGTSLEEVFWLDNNKGGEA